MYVRWDGIEWRGVIAAVCEGGSVWVGRGGEKGTGVCNVWGEMEIFYGQFHVTPLR